MNVTIVRLALMQIVAVVISVIASGVFLKARYGEGASPPLLATTMRQYGIWLLLIPTVWAVWAVVRSNRPRAGAGVSYGIVVSGVVILGGLVVFGVASCQSAMTTRLQVVVPLILM